MAQSFPPNHPYNIMLYHVSQNLKEDKAKINDLAFIMGLRKFGTIDNAADLFERLEDEGCLSEFKVTELGKAFDIIDLPEAAKKVKEYEEKALQDKTNNVTAETPYSPLNDDPPPYRPPSYGPVTQNQSMPPSNTSTDGACETDVVEEEAGNEPNSTIPAQKLPIKEETIPVEKIEELIAEDFHEPDHDKLPAKITSRKYHTVSGKSNRQGYPALSNGIYPDK